MNRDEKCHLCGGVFPKGDHDGHGIGECVPADHPDADAGKTFDEGLSEGALIGHMMREQDLAEARREIAKLREERDTLLVAIADAIDESADVYRVQDWPPDTVLGESGVDAMRAMDHARAGLQATLALPQFKDAKRVIRDERARLKEWYAKRHAELKAKLAAKRAEPKETP